MTNSIRRQIVEKRAYFLHLEDPNRSPDENWYRAIREIYVQERDESPEKIEDKYMIL